MKILVVDDEENILETIDLKLRKEGYTVFTAGTAEDGMRLFRLVKPDLLILDVMLPQRSGFELASAIRRDSNVPVIFLTARASVDDRIEGLELGDDYVTKPFSLAELMARVKSVLRRATGNEPHETVETGNLKIDPRTHEVFLGDSALDLSPKEFGLLYFLSRNRGQVFSREALLDRVWGQDAYVSNRTVDVHVRWLRERIEVEPGSPTRILTVRGVGYKFVS